MSFSHKMFLSNFVSALVDTLVCYKFTFDISLPKCTVYAMFFFSLYNFFSSVKVNIFPVVVT